MDVDGTKSAAVPESVMDSVKRTLVNVEEVRTQCLDFLSLSDPEVLAELPPLQRAESLLLLAKATTTLFAGKNPSSLLKQIPFSFDFEYCFSLCIKLIFISLFDFSFFSEAEM